jgi:hypothetical protein
MNALVCTYPDKGKYPLMKTRPYINSALRSVIKVALVELGADEYPIWYRIKNYRIEKECVIFYLSKH